MLNGRFFYGEEPGQFGICSRVLANAEVLPAAIALAQDIAVSTAPLSVAYSKRLLWVSWGIYARTRSSSDRA